MNHVLMILLWLFGAIALLAVAFLAYFAFAPRIGGNPGGERLQRVQASPNYRQGQFRNVVETRMDIPFGKMPGLLWQFLKGGEGREPKDTLPTVEFDRAAWAAVPDSSFAVAWFGHSSLLIKMGGTTFLVDPVFGKRASTFSFAGPKRFNYRHHITVEELPPVDVVLLSHDHYDHLDHETIVQLRNKRFVAPLGVGAHLERWGVPSSAITEVDWWESTDAGPVKLTLAPSRHFSGRGLNNRFSTLWGSWMLEAGNRKIYFGADSGYSPTFKEVGKRFGPVDLALLECGAYNALWSDIHMFPEQTAQAAVDLGARVLMPVHWAKFSLAMHPWKEPVERLSAKAKEFSMPLLTPCIGAIVVSADLSRSEPWWEGLQ
ncbi:MAG: MBL fold metallo-hydrolase [Bacteroidetes bacterium]|nr:MBL fold metallo-hydrolase [Bacteroidota bacterium]MBS1941307.1 MBL fold metallo-hydrolase [Bacteroidota bacterium]